MISAELSCNPYIREISVRFNGQPPHINSLIEKYQTRPLQDWVAEIPQIFHDEMNGYGFELDFYGTELDYEELCHAFREQGVPESDVQIVLKNDMECREIKIERIRDFLEWLGDHRYRHFDLQQFCLEHHELTEAEFVGIVMHGDSEKPKLKNVTLEKVDHVGELASTDLTHTPILYCVTEKSFSMIPKEITVFRRRNDVTDDQLFFRIGTDCNEHVVVRLLKDLGISAPKIVTGINDDAVRKYFLIYPFTDYISSAIDTFEQAAGQLTALLDADNKASKSQGDQTHEVLDKLTAAIQKTEQSDALICSQTKLDEPPEFAELTKQILVKISNWESRKTKITDTNAAQKAAIDFNSAALGFYTEFCLKIKAASEEYAKQIQQQYQEWFAAADPESGFEDHIVFQIGAFEKELLNQTEQLLSLKEERYADAKNSRLKHLFRSNEPTMMMEPVLETTYFYQVWRNHMMSVVVPAVNHLKQIMTEELNDYARKLSRIYHEQLQHLLNEKQTQRENITLNLSEDEQLLQKENDWVTRFVARLNSIERS